MISKPKKTLPFWLFIIPDQLIAAVFIAPIAPAIYALFLLRTNHAYWGFVILSVWLAVYVPLLSYCDRQGKVRLLVSVPGTVVILGLVIWILWFV